MKRLEIWRKGLLLVMAAIAVAPMLQTLAGFELLLFEGASLAALNLLGWSCVILLFLWRNETRGYIEPIADDLGIELGRTKQENVLARILHEVERKNQVLSLHLLEKRISSKEELTKTLQRIVTLTRQLLTAESVELALYDQGTGQYYSSFVVGKPFRTSAQAMLSGAVEGNESPESSDVIVQPIGFSGSILGSLRVGLREGRSPSIADRQLLHLLALQSGLALINSQYAAQLLKMRSASEESIKAKTGFLANLSHELRGPLGIMLNAVDILIDGLCGPISDDQNETLMMVRGNGEHLLELVNDVLDYAKVESGKVTTQKSEILLNPLLKDLCSVVRKQAEQKSHKLSYKNSDEALAVECDRRHLRQIMINLLTNAIKYTPDGGEIELWAERIPGGKIKINIKDSGIGIDPSDRDKVFAPFQRIESSYSLAQVGTGLGLSLTQRLVEVNHGQIQFDSQPQKGSHFWIILPSTQASQVIAPVERAEKPVIKGKGDKLLLIQREVGERNIILRYMVHLGFKVEVIDTQQGALNAVSQSPYQALLIDSDMLVDNDERFITSLREENSHFKIPIILLSSRAFVFDIERFLKAGIDRCLIKPLQLDELSQTVRQLIDGDYSGDVIDKSELETAAEPDRSSISRGKLIGVDDILH